MTHPIFHSKSVSSFLDIPEKLEIHNWLDATKRYFADCRHRALRHHISGVNDLLALREQSTLDEIKDIKNTCIAHIIEDCYGFLPSVEDWISEMRSCQWMRAKLDKKGVLEKCVRRCKGKGEDYAFIYDFLNEGHASQKSSRKDPRTGYLRLHSYGIFLAEEKFGVFFKNSDGDSVPTRYIAETCVKNMVSKNGVIPSVADWLQEIRFRPWMNRPKKLAKEDFSDALEKYSSYYPKEG